MNFAPTSSILTTSPGLRCFCFFKTNNDPQKVACNAVPWIKKPACGGTRPDLAEVKRQLPPSPAAPQFHPPLQKVTSLLQRMDLGSSVLGTMLEKFLINFSAELCGTHD